MAQASFEPETCGSRALRSAAAPHYGWAKCDQNYMNNRMWGSHLREMVDQKASIRGCDSVCNTK